MSHSAPRAIASFFTQPRLLLRFEAPKHPNFPRRNGFGPPRLPSDPTGTQRPFPSSFPCFLPSPRLETSHPLKYGSLELPSLPHSALRRCLATALPGGQRGTRRRGLSGRGGAPPEVGCRGPHHLSRAAGGVSFSGWVSAFRQFGLTVLVRSSEAELSHFPLLERSGYLFNSAGPDVHL